MLTGAERELLLLQRRPVDVLQRWEGVVFVHFAQWECVQEVMVFPARASVGAVVDGVRLGAADTESLGFTV